MAVLVLNKHVYNRGCLAQRKSKAIVQRKLNLIFDNI